MKRIKEQLHALPDHGVGYGLLRHLNPATAGRLDDRPLPQMLSTTWVGSRPRLRPTGAKRRADVLGSGVDAATPLAHAVEVNALTLDGADGATLSATWSWAPALLPDDAVADLAQGWFCASEALVRHAAQPGAGGRTPCDLPLVSLSQDQIEGLERRYPQMRMCCRSLRCRRACCSTRCTMRRQPTCTRCSWWWV